MHCLRGMPGLKNINLDEYWSYSCTTVGQKGTRASCSALSNACSASNEVATYIATGQNKRWTVHVHAHNYPPDTLANLIQALQDLQLLATDGHYFIHDTLNTLQHIYWNINCQKRFPNIVHKTMQSGLGGLGNRKKYLTPNLRPLVERIYNV